MGDVETLARRLAARGYFEISPTTIGVRSFTTTDNEGRIVTAIEYGPAFAVTWAPTGQAGPRGPHRFNPFCARRFEDRSLVEALRHGGPCEVCWDGAPSGDECVEGDW